MKRSRRKAEAINKTVVEDLRCIRELLEECNRRLSEALEYLNARLDTYMED
jgi:hypothetical protein